MAPAEPLPREFRQPTQPNSPSMERHIAKLHFTERASVFQIRRHETRNGVDPTLRGLNGLTPSFPDRLGHVEPDTAKTHLHIFARLPTAPT